MKISAPVAAAAVLSTSAMAVGTRAVVGGGPPAHDSSTNEMLARGFLAPAAAISVPVVLGQFRATKPGPVGIAIHAGLSVGGLIGSMAGWHALSQK